MSSPKPAGVDRLAQLTALHLYGMATAWSELLAEGPRRPVQPEAWLDRLIEAELTIGRFAACDINSGRRASRCIGISPPSIGRKRLCRRRRSSNWPARPSCKPHIT